MWEADGPICRKPRGNPGKITWGETARIVSGVGGKPPAKLRVDPVITRWQHEAVEMILRVWEARESGRSACSL